MKTPFHLYCPICGVDAKMRDGLPYCESCERPFPMPASNIQGCIRGGTGLRLLIGKKIGIIFGIIVLGFFVFFFLR